MLFKRKIVYVKHYSRANRLCVTSQYNIIFRIVRNHLCFNYGFQLPCAGPVLPEEEEGVLGREPEERPAGGGEDQEQRGLDGRQL